MIYLTPYENPFYFIILGVALIPAVAFLLREKRQLWYQNILTIAFLWISFAGPNIRQGIALILYIIWQIVVLTLYFHYRKNKNGSWPFYLAVIGAILPLFLMKVTPFATHHPSVLGFLGISYLTFKSVQMIMEIRDGMIKEYRTLDYIQFLIFFPTISSGPIDRFRRFQEDLANPPKREVYVEMLGNGISRIFLGFLYKFVIGYLLGSQLMPRVQNMALEQGSFTIWVIAYMYVYSMYLFFDFAGYSLFAVGVSEILGYETPMNFNKPFLSPNIKEFWNRWHMSLSFWFRDYVYMRLMFTLIKKKVFKSRIVASNVGYFALFLLMGVWHGLTWYYLAYGVYHASLICITDMWLRFKKKHKKQIPSNIFTKGLGIFLTFNAVCVSFLIFSGFLNTLFFGNPVQ